MQSTGLEVVCGLGNMVEMSLEHRRSDRSDRWGREARQKVQGKRGKGHPGWLGRGSQSEQLCGLLLVGQVR